MCVHPPLLGWGEGPEGQGLKENKGVMDFRSTFLFEYTSLIIEATESCSATLNSHYLRHLLCLCNRAKGRQREIKHKKGGNSR